MPETRSEHASHFLGDARRGSGSRRSRSPSESPAVLGTALWRYESTTPLGSLHPRFHPDQPEEDRQLATKPQAKREHQMCTKPPDFGGQVGCPPLPGLAPSPRKDDAWLTGLPAAGRIHPNRTLEAVGSIPISSTFRSSKPLESGAFLMP